MSQNISWSKVLFSWKQFNGLIVHFSILCYSSFAEEKFNVTTWQKFYLSQKHSKNYSVFISNFFAYFQRKLIFYIFFKYMSLRFMFCHQTWANSQFFPKAKLTKWLMIDHVFSTRYNFINTTCNVYSELKWMWMDTKGTNKNSQHIKQNFFFVFLIKHCHGFDKPFYNFSFLINNVVNQTVHFKHIVTLPGACYVCISTNPI